MKLQEFNFPTLTAADIAFSTIKTDKTLLFEAENKKQELREHVKLFNELFFRGGKLYFKEDISDDFKNKCAMYLKAFMSSFEPKHEHKEIVSAYLLSELVDIKKYSL